MKKIICVLSLLFVCAGPAVAASELSKINAEIKQTQQQNKKLAEKVQSSEREISKTKKQLVNGNIYALLLVVKPTIMAIFTKTKTFIKQ